MVNLASEPVEVRRSASYDLGRVRELAADQKVNFAGHRPYEQSLDLGYEFEDVCACLARLEPHQFRKSLRYVDQPSWHDVYLVNEVSPTGESVTLYIKFKLFGSQLSVFVCSFHD